MAKGEKSCFINVESCRLKIEFHLGKAFKRMPEQGAKFANAKRHHLYALHSIIVSRKKVLLHFLAESNFQSVPMATGKTSTAVSFASVEDALPRTVSSKSRTEIQFS